MLTQGEGARGRAKRGGGAQSSVSRCKSRKEKSESEGEAEESGGGKKKQGDEHRLLSSSLFFLLFSQPLRPSLSFTRHSKATMTQISKKRKVRLSRPIHTYDGQRLGRTAKQQQQQQPKGGSDVSRRSTFVRSAAAPPPLVDGSPAGSSIAPAFRNLLWGVAKALFGCFRSKPEERDGRRWRKARGPQRWRPSSSAEAKAAATLGLLHLRSSSLSVLDAPPNLCAREAPSEISRSRCVFFRWEKGSSLASAPRMIRGPRAIFPSLTRFALKTTRKK